MSAADVGRRLTDDMELCNVALDPKEDGIQDAATRKAAIVGSCAAEDDLESQTSSWSDKKACSPARSGRVRKFLRLDHSSCDEPEGPEETCEKKVQPSENLSTDADVLEIANRQGFRKEGMRFFHKLSMDHEEKEASALAQIASPQGSGKYPTPMADFVYNAQLSQRAKDLGNIFVQIASGEILPAGAERGGRNGFYVEDAKVLAFRGISGLDLSLIWHMLLIPTAQAMQATCRSCGDIEHKMFPGSGVRRWVFDLLPEDIPLLRDLRERGETFVCANKSYFQEKWAGKTLKGHDILYWLRPENLQFGFHASPTIGYLHCHLLVGPLTEFGYSPRYLEGWLTLDRVLCILEQGHACADLLKNPSLGLVR
ncbi:Hypothetical Protein FCC1311_030932 [Hondaea fermentalgiana]|uniref:Uncharacterized protein n=1 Tax=Hondaea fermentalgiana TaxID=2315210 RepID=A0A2R5GF53_9STRA|nr:Hypothetical Protein FCC1311_030932 [Hondaea fermentalgiana]|eukprot:GBG26871.1 Hypothetical Protein FCC1311_030932 [Hondaea fermentalgiana]